MLSIFSLLQLIPVIICITFIIQQNHLLMSLLALEGITLRLVLVVPLILTLNLLPVSASCVIILSLGACEASLGLALLVSAARSTGSDILNTLSINKC